MLSSCVYSKILLRYLTKARRSGRDADTVVLQTSSKVSGTFIEKPRQLIAVVSQVILRYTSDDGVLVVGTVVGRD